MKEIKITITGVEAKLLSNILAAVITLMKSLGMYRLATDALRSLKEKIDNELLKK